MIYDLISMSAGLLYGVPIVLFIITGNLSQLIGFVGLFATMGLTEFIKYYVVKESSRRPLGASNCNLWCNDGIQEDKPGMPSSHSSQVSFFASYYSQQTTNPWIRAGLFLYAGAVMFSRYKKRCHTIPQITVGASIGALIGMCVNNRA